MSSHPHAPLHRRVALVTGASRGIGAAAARAFAAAGADVALVARDEDALAAVAADVEAAGVRAAVLPADLSDPEAADRVVTATVDRLGRLDAAFNNAGAGHRPLPLAEHAPDAFAATIAANLTSVFSCMRAELAVMAAAGTGAIVNTSSTAGAQAAPGMGPYAAAKAGVIALTKVAAVDYAKQGVRVNALTPGPIENEQIAAAPKEARDRTAAAVPMGRLGTPEEVAQAAVWLCTDAAAFVTGAVLAVDGGRLA